MTTEEIEKEIQARIEFKMNEFLTGIKNVAAINWQIAFQKGSVKHSHYWEAFKQMEEMFKKEINMGTPHNEMDKRKKWEAKEKAVDNISKSLDLRGRHDYDHKIRIIVSEIEQAQNY